MGLYWGCTYNNRTDPATQNLQTPLRKDMLQVWQRSWAVIRIRMDNPGMWPLHCHMEQHIPLGMAIVFNVLPSEQPIVPPDVPTCGPCTKTNIVHGNAVQELDLLRREYADMVELVAALKANNSLPLS